MRSFSPSEFSEIKRTYSGIPRPEWNTSALPQVDGFRIIDWRLPQKGDLFLNADGDVTQVILSGGPWVNRLILERVDTPRPPFAELLGLLAEIKFTYMTAQIPSLPPHAKQYVDFRVPKNGEVFLGIPLTLVEAREGNYSSGEKRLIVEPAPSFWEYVTDGSPRLASPDHWVLNAESAAGFSLAVELPEHLRLTKRLIFERRRKH